MTLDELREETLILMQEGAGVRQILEDALRRLGVRLRDLDVRLELGLQESVRRAVEAGFGVTFISRTAVESELADGRLAEARVEGLEATRVISLASAAGRTRTRVAEAFVEFARSASRDRLRSRGLTHAVVRTDDVGVLVEYASLVAAMAVLTASLTGAFGQKLSVLPTSSGAAISTLECRSRCTEGAGRRCSRGLQEGPVLQAGAEVPLRRGLDRRQEEPSLLPLRPHPADGDGAGSARGDQEEHEAREAAPACPRRPEARGHGRGEGDRLRV